MRINGRNITTIVSDFDGTILKRGEWEPPQKFYDVINASQAQGYLFVAASGRQYPNMHAMLHKLDKDIVYICENGCLVMYQGKLLHKETISDDLAKELVADLMRQGEGTDITVSGEKSCYMVPSDSGFIDIMEQVVRYQITRLESFEEIPEEPLKISIHFAKGIPMDVKEWFRRKYSDRLQVVEAGNNFLDFNPLRSGKGEALKVIAEKLEFSVEECMAFGDSENDISMLRTVGISFAMENANEYVKAEADYICESVEDVIAFLLEEESRLRDWVCNLAISAGKEAEEAERFWNKLKADSELLEELEYYSRTNNFLCKYKVSGYTVADILVWQVDHFKAYLDRHEEVNRYRQDRLLYNAFDVLLQMRETPEFYVNKLQGETGTDFENKYR